MDISAYETVSATKCGSHIRNGTTELDLTVFDHPRPLRKELSGSLVFFFIRPGGAHGVIASWLGYRVAYFSEPRCA
jgi:hypothetical protein